MRVDQIGLLLWKNYIVRKRQPVIIIIKLYNLRFARSYKQRNDM